MRRGVADVELFFDEVRRGCASCGPVSQDLQTSSPLQKIGVVQLLHSLLTALTAEVLPAVSIGVQHCRLFHPLCDRHRKIFMTTKRRVHVVN